MRTQLAHCRLINLGTVERTPNRLRDSMAYCFTLCLLGQCFFGPASSGDVDANTRHKALTSRIGSGKLKYEPMVRCTVLRGHCLDDFLRLTCRENFKIVFVRESGRLRR